MKWIIRIFSSLLAVVLATSCSSDSPKPTPEPDLASRTVLVYMVATNNLGTDGADADDLAEMKAAAATGALGDGRWLVYHAASDASDPRLVEITATGENVLKTYESGSSVTAARMSEVIDDARELAPASSYGMVFWSHASGWIQDGIEESLPDPSAAAAPLSFGSDFGKRMNITTLRSVLEGRGMDYLYFDACYMATVEVAYELRDVASYIVGSASELPRDGMPYDLNMAPLVRGFRDDLVQAATNTFDNYDKKSDPELRTCTMAVIATDALDDLAGATAAIYRLTPLPHPGKNVTNYRGTARQGYSLDFGEYVNALADASRIDPSLTDAFNNALARAVVYRAATDKLWNEWTIYSHSGLSTYVFNSARDYDLKGYDELAWARDVVSHHTTANTEE